MDIKRKHTNMRRRSIGAGVPGRNTWMLSLYVAGQGIKGVTALNNLKSICEDRLSGRYHIDVIDLLKNPRLAREKQICAVPTLVRTLPRPVKNIIGDLSNTTRVLAGLDIIPKESIG